MSDGRAKRGRSELRVESRLVRLNHFLQFAHHISTIIPSLGSPFGPQPPLSEPDLLKSSITFSLLFHRRMFFGHFWPSALPKDGSTDVDRRLIVGGFLMICAFLLIENDHT